MDAHSSIFEILKGCPFDLEKNSNNNRKIRHANWYENTMTQLIETKWPHGALLRRTTWVGEVIRVLIRESKDPNICAENFFSDFINLLPNQLKHLILKVLDNHNS